MNAGNTVVASDLDRTLIYSENALKLGTAPGAIVCVENYQDRPQSFSTARSLEMLGKVSDVALFVPVTTRTPEQYRRVELLAEAPRYAICSNGGDLLVEGDIDLDWHDHVHKLVASESEPLDVVMEHIELSLSDRASGVRLRSAADLFAYAAFDPVPGAQAIDPEWVKALTQWAQPKGWTVSAQGHKVYCVPKSLLKSNALREVMTRTGRARAISAGDSLLDKDLLLAGDRAIRPAHGELHQTGWIGPNTQVTRSAGASAGEEIVDWFWSDLQS